MKNIYNTDEILKIANEKIFNTDLQKKIFWQRGRKKRLLNMLKKQNKNKKPNIILNQK